MELRVSEKGAVSIYYLNRFPFTLYMGEWNAVFDATRLILRFVAGHHLQLSCRCPDQMRHTLRDLLDGGHLGTETRIGSLWCHKSLKGAVSLYGLRRFPVTLYCDQWLRVLGERDRIESFIETNGDRLERKGCCVPRARRISECRPFRETVGADNIIRPMATRELRT